MKMLPVGEVEEMILALVRCILDAPEMGMALGREREKLDADRDRKAGAGVQSR